VQEHTNRVSIEQWLNMPDEGIANYISPLHISVMYIIDGSRRHFLLSQPEADYQKSIDDFDFLGYGQHTANQCVSAYNLFFSHGIEIVMQPALYPPNFLRGAKYVKGAVGLSKALWLKSPYSELYEKFGVRCRLYGDYDVAPNAALVRQGIDELAEMLEQATPKGEKLLLQGFNAGSFNDELIARAINLQAELGRIPTELELRQKCYPFGPTKIDLLIDSGRLKSGTYLPSLLDGGKTDLYFLNHLAFDLERDTLRHILYDHIFLRPIAPEDDMSYSAEILIGLKSYYTEHKDCLVGVGRLTSSGQLWYSNHRHISDV